MSQAELATSKMINTAIDELVDMYRNTDIILCIFTATSKTDTEQFVNNAVSKICLHNKSKSARAHKNDK